MNLLGAVLSVLESQGTPYALIGAVALGVHGVSRATADVDLLTVDGRVLRDSIWDPEPALQGVSRRILRGDFDDPLAGSVRFRTHAEVIDVVVGRYAWQREIVAAAPATSIGVITLPVARPAGLILLKLFAGGPQDAWDIRALLAALGDARPVREEVSAVIPRLPADAQRLWGRLQEE